MSNVSLAAFKIILGFTMSHQRQGNIRPPAAECLSL